MKESIRESIRDSMNKTMKQSGETNNLYASADRIAKRQTIVQQPIEKIDRTQSLKIEDLILVDSQDEEFDDILIRAKAVIHDKDKGHDTYELLKLEKNLNELKKNLDYEKDGVHKRRVLREVGRKREELLAVCKERINMFGMFSNLNEKIDKLATQMINGSVGVSVEKAYKTEQGFNPQLQRIQEQGQIFDRLVKTNSQFYHEANTREGDRQNGGRSDGVPDKNGVLHQNFMKDIEFGIGLMFKKLENKIDKKLDVVFDSVTKAPFNISEDRRGQKQKGHSSKDKTDIKALDDFNYELGTFDTKIERHIQNLDRLKNMPDNYKDLEEYDKKFKLGQSRALKKQSNFQVKLEQLRINEDDTPSELTPSDIGKSNQKAKNTNGKKLKSILHRDNSNSSKKTLRINTSRLDESDDYDKGYHSKTKKQSTKKSPRIPKKSKGKHTGIDMNMSINNSLMEPKSPISVIQERSNYHRERTLNDMDKAKDDTVYRSIVTDYISCEETIKDISWQEPLLMRMKSEVKQTESKTRTNNKSNSRIKSYKGKNEKSRPMSRTSSRTSLYQTRNELCTRQEIPDEICDSRLGASESPIKMGKSFKKSPSRLESWVPHIEKAYQSPYAKQVSGTGMPGLFKQQSENIGIFDS